MVPAARSRSGARRRAPVLLLSGAFAAYAIYWTSLWPHVVSASSHDADRYPERRVKSAFGGIPIETVRAELDEWEGRAAIEAGLAFLAFAVAILVVSPFRIGWHVETALGRLLLHPASFFAIAPLLLLGDRTEGPRRAHTPR